jgi:hypothetical protein
VNRARTVEDEAESLGWSIVQNLVAQGTETDRLALDSVLRSVESGKHDSRSILRELKKRRRPQPGEFGVTDLSSGVLLSLVISAVFEFVRRFAKKFADKSGEIVAEKTLKALLEKKLASEADLAPTWDELEQSFATKAKELGLPASSYRAIMEHVRDNPALLIKVPTRSK